MLSAREKGAVACRLRDLRATWHIRHCERKRSNPEISPRKQPGLLPPTREKMKSAMKTLTQPLEKSLRRFVWQTRTLEQQMTSILCTSGNGIYQWTEIRQVSSLYGIMGQGLGRGPAKQVQAGYSMALRSSGSWAGTWN